MPQKPLEQGKIEQARELRRQGASIEAIASELGISVGAVSKHTRDIPKPMPRAPVVKKQGGKKPSEGKAIRDPAAEAAMDEETKELANRLKRARLENELEAEDDKKRQRSRLLELETRERELRLQLDEARGKAAGGDSSVNEEIRELRQHLNDLTEERHRQEIYQMESRHQADMATLQRQIASQRQTGLTEYDLMSQLFTKGERLIYKAGFEAHSLFSEIRNDNLSKEAIQMGISVEEYRQLLGQHTPREVRQGRVELLELSLLAQERQLTDEENARLMALQESTARAEAAWRGHREALLQQISLRRLGGGRQPVTMAGRKGHAPAPGEPEPPVLKAESRLVTCSRCQTTFDVDLVELRQQGVPGKRLFVACPNSKCQFLLDITEMIPELAKTERPECYALGPYGCASRGSFSQCRDCQWGDFVSVTYE